MSSLAYFMRNKFSGKDIKEIREILNVSQDKFSKILGISGMTVYGWESGRIKEISEENQVKIVAIVNDLLRYDEEAERQ